MIREAVYKLLTTNATIAALVGTNVYHQQRVPRDGLPALVIADGDDRAVNHLKGASGADTGFVRVYAIAARPLDARDLGNTVRDALNGFAGTVNLNEGSVRVGHLLDDGQRPVPHDQRDGQERPAAHAVVRDFAYLTHASP